MSRAPKLHGEEAVRMSSLLQLQEEGDGHFGLELEPLLRLPEEFLGR